MKVTYSSNNSGGSWWLEDKDWFALEQAGWEVDWKKDDEYYKKLLSEDGRWLGALATEATIETTSMEEAIRMWEEVTGQSAEEEGCPCCGQPHNFYVQR